MFDIFYDYIVSIITSTNADVIKDYGEVLDSVAFLLTLLSIAVFYWFVIYLVLWTIRFLSGGFYFD